MKIFLKLSLIVFGGTILLGILLNYSFISGKWFTLDVFVLLVIASIVQRREYENQKKGLDTFLSNVKGFQATKKFINSKSLIAIDEKTKQIIVKENKSVIRKYPYEDLLSCQIIEDDVVTYDSKKLTGSVVARGIVGGVLLGPLGTLIGSTTGKGRTIKNKSYKNLHLKLVFEDIEKPNFKINFFDVQEITNSSNKTIKTSDLIYGGILRKTINDLEEWKDVIDLIISRNDKERQVKPVTVTNITHNSVSDELTKLHELKGKGILSEDEFNIQKNKILNSWYIVKLRAKKLNITIEKYLAEKLYYTI